jgi:hypothetical protein
VNIDSMVPGQNIFLSSITLLLYTLIITLDTGSDTFAHALVIYKICSTTCSVTATTSTITLSDDLDLSISALSATSITMHTV